MIKVERISAKDYGKTIMILNAECPAWLKKELKKQKEERRKQKEQENSDS